MEVVGAGVCEREPLRDPADTMPRREANDEALDGFGVSPMIGASAGIGLPGTAMCIRLGPSGGIPTLLDEVGADKLAALARAVSVAG